MTVEEEIKVADVQSVLDGTNLVSQLIEFFCFAYTKGGICISRWHDSDVEHAIVGMEAWERHGVLLLEAAQLKRKLMREEEDE